MLAEIGRRADVLEESNRSLEREVTERREIEDALRLSEQRNRVLVTAVTAVIWNTDHRGHFALEQASWQAYTGQKPDDYRGTGWRRAFLADDQFALDLAWATAADAPAMFELELRLWHAASATHRYVRLRAVPVLRDAEITEWIGTIDDIDDRRRAQEELTQLNAELEQRVARRTAELEAANKEMETFSYSVSHDLRAPVRAIVGFGEIMREDHGEQLDAEGRRKLDIILDEAKRMGQLIDDLLAFSRLGRQSIEPVTLDMTEMARRMFDRLASQNGAARAELRLGSLPSVVGDRALVDQVWANLVANAIKYSSKREHPLIEIGAISDETEHIYYVRDNGAGFDPRYKSKLFGVFQRLHDASEFSGTGVGLALVQRIVMRHHGRVWAEGKPDQGASFYFALPREVPDAAS
jgi:signal transduction histidine kinase